MFPGGSKNPHRGADGLFSVGLAGDRCAEEDQHAVAKQLGDRALAVHDGLAHPTMGAGNAFAPRLGARRSTIAVERTMSANRIVTGLRSLSP